MERAYWLSRKRAALSMAQKASSSEARLIHYDLAGRYSVRAIASQLVGDVAQAGPPQPCAIGYKPVKPK